MRIFLTLDKILNLLKTNTTATKRELYYQNVNEYENQVKGTGFENATTETSESDH
jgi:DNA topoisomerase VI subunit A